MPTCAVCRCEVSLAHVSAQPVCRPRVALRPPHFLLLSLPFSSPRPPPSQRPLPPACPGSPLHSVGLCGRPVPPPRPCPRGVGFFTFPSPSLSTLFPCPNPCHRSNLRPKGGLLQEAHPDFLAEHALSSLCPFPWSEALPPLRRGRGCTGDSPPCPDGASDLGSPVAVLAEQESWAHSASPPHRRQAPRQCGQDRMKP